MSTTNRRDFLKGAAWMGAAAAVVGCSTTKGFGFGAGGSMAEYADAPFKRLRVGIIGLGRGMAGVRGFNVIPGCEITAICDLNAVRVNETLAAIEKAGRPAPKVYTGGPEEWKRLCDDENVDLVYNATPWELHVPIALYAMRAGKHVATEVPAAFTVDECWELVEASEKLKRHCMQLENCCYGETEMLALNLCRLGKLGELVHAEGAYIHDLRSYNYGDWLERSPGWDEAEGVNAYWDFWRLRHNVAHKGNQYPTHGLGPICWYMDINRGDRFDYLVSMNSASPSFEGFAKAKKKGTPLENLKFNRGDVNFTLIRTARGRIISLQHNVATPRPYDRVNQIVGTKGVMRGIDGAGYKVCFEKELGDRGAGKYFPPEEAERIRKEYMHPLWRQAGELAKKIGGHGGCDFMMDVRWAYCLQNGLPLDTDVYDLATWSSVIDLTARSVRSGSRPVDCPDFTRGAWKTAKPVGIEGIDLAKMGLA